MQTMTADSAQANKARQQSLIDTLQNKGEIGRIREFIRADVVDHSKPPGLPEGIDGVEALFSMIRQAFPDHDAKVIHIVAEGDMVATYKTFTGTNLGPFFGAPPTGKKATIHVMDFVRYADGKVVENWNIVDTAGLMRQLAA